MKKYLNKIKSFSGGMSMVALLLAMTTFAGATTYTIGALKSGQEETIVGVGKEMNKIIQDAGPNVPITHAAAPFITGHNVNGKKVILEGQSLTFNLSATISDNGELSYRWKSRKEGSMQEIEVGTGSSFTYTPGPGVHYFHGEAVNTNIHVNGQQTAVSKTPEIIITVLAKAEVPTLSGFNTYNTLYNIHSANYSVSAYKHDNGELTYQWFKTNASGTVIQTLGTSSSLSVVNPPIGLHYYRLEVTNTVRYPAYGFVHSSKAVTPVITVESIQHAERPTLVNMQDFAMQSGSTRTLSTQATVTDGGTLSYRWYENTSNSRTGATQIGTTPTIAISHNANLLNQPIVRYYFADVTNTLTKRDSRGGEHISSLTTESNIMRLEVYPYATVPSVSALTDKITKSGVGVSYSVSASGFNGTVKYEWYENTTNAVGGTLVNSSGSSFSKTYTVSAPTVKYISVKVTNSYTYNAINGQQYVTSESRWSNVAKLEIYPEATTPTVGTLSNRIVNSGDSVGYSASVSGHNGTLSYVWYENSTNATGGTTIGTSNAVNITKTTTGLLTRYISLKVRNTYTYTAQNGQVFTEYEEVWSNVAIVEFLAPAATPTVSTLSNINVAPGGSGTFTITASTTDGGALSYQWYKTTSQTNTGGTAVGTNNKTFTASGLGVGDHFYYVKVTNTRSYNTVSGGTQTRTATNNSNSVKLTMLLNAQTPTVGNLTNRIVANGASTSFSAGASTSDGGTLTYKWYENTSNAYGGTVVGTSASFSKTYSGVTSPIKRYYYVEVVNTKSHTSSDGTVFTDTASARSNIAMVEIYPVASTPSVSITGHQVRVSGASASYTSSVSGHNGSLSYAWYENTANGVGGTWISGSASISRAHSVSANTIRYISLYVTNTYSYTASNGTVHTTTAGAWSGVSRFEIYPAATTPGVSITGHQITTAGGWLGYYSSVWGQNGSISYAWYENTSNAHGGTWLTSASSVGRQHGGQLIRYISLYVTNTYTYTSVSGTVYTSTAGAWSGVSRYETYEVANTPSAWGVSNQTVYMNAFSSTAYGSGNGSISYAWYSGHSGGSHLTSAQTLSQSGLRVGAHYYRVHVTNTRYYTSASGAAYNTSAQSIMYLTVNSYEYVVWDRTNLRSTANGTLITTLPIGTRLTWHGNTASAGGDTWYYVSTSNGYTGWMVFGGVVREHSSQYRVGGTGLNLRSGGSTSYSVVTSMPAYSKIYVISAPSSGWWRIVYNGYAGYASPSYLESY